MFFGCSEIVALSLNSGLPLRTPCTKASRYLCQRTAAGKRGVAWEISFPEWIAVWAASDCWNLRGRGIGRYCMARHGDIGPYKVNNISIQLCEKNSRDGIEVGRPAMRLAHQLRTTLGRGRGWTYIHTAKRPYQVMLAKKYIGSFATETEAVSAYKLAADCEKHRLLSLFSV